MSLTTRKKMRLIHYGANGFDPARWEEPADGFDFFKKPHGGLWTSPVDSEYGWVKFCANTDIDIEVSHFQEFFEFDYVGDILVIDRARDLNKLPWAGPADFQKPLFSPLRLMGVDAIHLTVRGQQETRHTRPHNLYGWDCESVLILNPAGIAVDCGGPFLSRTPAAVKSPRALQSRRQKSLDPVRSARE